MLNKRPFQKSARLSLTFLIILGIQRKPVSIATLVKLFELQLHRNQFRRKVHFPLRSLPASSISLRLKRSFCAESVLLILAYYYANFKSPPQSRKYGNALRFTHTLPPQGKTEARWRFRLTWGRGGGGTATQRLKLGIFRYQAFNEMNLIFSGFFSDYVRNV